MKVCRYCAMDIPEKASICPYCRKKQGMGCFLKAVIIIVGLILFSQILNHCDGSGTKTEFVYENHAGQQNNVPMEERKNIRETLY